jgi:rhamnogalacturonyl hydrolase YesR
MICAIAIAATLTLEADIHSIAALPGEPATVAAATVTHDGRLLLTLENPWAFDPSSPRRRAVLVGGSEESGAAAVLDMVRWFKTSAPPVLREQWAVSVLPSAEAGPSDRQALERWLRFQAPDVVIEVVSAGSKASGLTVDDVPARVIENRARPEALGDALNLAGTAGRSVLHSTIVTRVLRDPLTIANVLAARYPETPAISYITALSWIGALRLSDLTADTSFREKVRRQTEPWTNGAQPLFGDRILLTSIAGTTVFSELARRGTPAASALAERGAALAAARKNNGIAEYGQGWTDDMFMASSILAHDGARSGRMADIDVAARLLIDYAKRLQRPDGLFNHADDGPAAWGRGNGFAAFGLMELLSVTPERHDLRPTLVDIFGRLMAAAKLHQSPDGMFRQVIDERGAYREETATAMLMTAMARGVARRWLDDSYRDTIERAWRGLLAHVTAEGTIIDVCTGTGAGPTTRYYLDREALTGADDRGGAMALVAALEIDEFRRLSSRRP